MDNNAFKMFLQNIEEYVMDEDKIVTYKWLSKNFDIHVNTAKQLLYSFASEQKDKVHLTYLICGFLKNGIGTSVQIVREDDVDKIKGEFKVVTSEHVYSVQKTKMLPDLNILYTVDMGRNDGKDDTKRLSSINSGHSVLRPHEEVARLKRITQCAAEDTNEKKWLSAKKPTVSSTNKVIEDKKQIEEGGNSKAVGEDTANKKDQKKGGIVAMFAAQSIKTKKQNVEVKSNTVETKKPKSGSGISAFFSRHVDLMPARPKNDSGVSSQSDSQDSPKKMEIDSKNTTDNVKIIENNNIAHKNDKSIKLKKESNKKDIASKSKDIKQKSDEKKGSRGKNKKSNVTKDLPPTKKRKRIVVMSDSEDSDDDVFGKEEEDVCYSPAPQPQQPDTDGEDIIPPTPEASLQKGRKRIRKFVDKTYMDEDGYMLTRKEYIFESCTESEPEEEKEKENKSKDCSEQVKTEKLSPKVDIKEPLLKKKKVSPQNTKQASIMNFFKKK